MQKVPFMHGRCKARGGYYWLLLVFRVFETKVWRGWTYHVSCIIYQAIGVWGRVFFTIHLFDIEVVVTVILLCYSAILLLFYSFRVLLF